MADFAAVEEDVAGPEELLTRGVGETFEDVAIIRLRSTNNNSHILATTEADNNYLTAPM